MSPLSRKEHDSIWSKSNSVPGACVELQAAVGPHARGRTSFPQEGLGSLLLPRPRWWPWGRQWTLKGWKAHGKNGRGKTTPNGKWPNVSGVGADPAFLPGHCQGIVLSAHGALFSGIMQQPPKTSPASEPGGGPLDNSAQVYEFG